jgi:hypothetical protein
LKWAQYQLISYDTVKTDPEKTEPLF